MQKGDKERPRKYRGIALLSIVGKVFLYSVEKRGIKGWAEGGRREKEHCLLFWYTFVNIVYTYSTASVNQGAGSVCVSV